MKVLELQNVYKAFEENEYVVNDACFDVEQGDFIVIIGPSGCGKTTILNMIAGLEEVTTGKIYINNKMSNNIECKDRNIAMVFQNYALYPHLTVYENMAFSLRNKKIDKNIIEKKINKTSALLKIEGLLNRKPSQLSGGQKQRVAIGRAIVRNPVMFLMDEPLSNLDTALRNEMREELKKLHKNLNATIVYVTHDQIEALTLANKIIVINDGVINQVGSPIELYENPQNEFVAQFLGSPKMNIFKNIEVLNKDGENYIKLFDNEIKISKSITSNKVDVGIRAEHINYDNIKRKLEFNVEIKYYELIGSEYLVHGNTKSEQIVFKLDSSIDLKKYKKIKLGINLEKLHFFDSETKERI